VTGEISTVRIVAAGLGTKRVCLANLPTYVPDSVIRRMMSRFSHVRKVLAETWSTAYSYPVANEIRIAVMTLRTHVPSNIVVVGQSACSYEGQPAICYGCDETGRVYQDCPRRRRGKEVEVSDYPPTWTEVDLGGEAPDRGSRSMGWVRGFRLAFWL
jgi:hypothetical protein